MRINVRVLVSAFEFSSKARPERWVLAVLDATRLGPALSRLNELCHPGRVTLASWLREEHGINWADDPGRWQQFGRRARARFDAGFGEPEMIRPAWQWISRRSGFRKVVSYPYGFGSLVFHVEWRASIAPVLDRAMADGHEIRPTGVGQPSDLAVEVSA